MLVGLRGYQLDRIRTWLDPWSDPLGTGFHTIQGLLALGLGGILGAGLGESRLAGGLFLPNASNDYIFAIIGEEFGLIGAGIVILLFVGLAYSGIRVSLAAPDTFGALLAAGITAWLCIQAFINIGVVVALIPVTGITLPFISAGGSSLTISLAAVGILLSISRETVERGTWNDAAADRRGRDGRAHLPGPRRGPLAPRPVNRPTAPDLVWLGGHRGLEADLVARRGDPRPAAGAALAPDRRPVDQHRPRSDPARAVRPAGRGDPRGRAAGGDLDDRRLRRGPGPPRRRPAPDPGRPLGGQRDSRPGGPGDGPARRRARRVLRGRRPGPRRAPASRPT